MKHDLLLEAASFFEKARDHGDRGHDDDGLLSSCMFEYA